MVNESRNPVCDKTNQSTSRSLSNVIPQSSYKRKDKVSSIIHEPNQRRYNLPRCCSTRFKFLIISSDGQSRFNRCFLGDAKRDVLHGHPLSVTQCYRYIRHMYSIPDCGCCKTASAAMDSSRVLSYNGCKNFVHACHESTSHWDNLSSPDTNQQRAVQR